MGDHNFTGVRAVLEKKVGKDGRVSGMREYADEVVKIIIFEKVTVAPEPPKGKKGA